jgi:Na+/H+ antiporter NhaD/arsenite permease-like protein
MLELLGLKAFAPEIALGSIVLLLVAFAREKWSPVVVAIGGMAFFLLTGMVDTNGMLESLSNNAPWTIIAMFILSGALVRTGVL